MIKLKKKHKAMLMSYVRSCVAAGLAVYMTGNTDPSDIGKAAVAAILPVIMRWANPSDKAFGRGGGGGEANYVV
jgi:hypothetical protein